MIKHALSLFVALLLAAGPAAAQMQEGAATGKGGRAGATGSASVPGTSAALPGLPNAAPGLTGSLPGGAAPVLAAIAAAAANPASLRALAANPSPAAAYARALIAAPVTPLARAEAVKTLGEAVVARLEAGVKTLSASAALKTVAAEFAALERRAPEAPPVAGASKRAWRALKAATIAATVTVVMAAAAPAIVAQERVLQPKVPTGNVLVMAGAAQTQAAYTRASDMGDILSKWTRETKVIAVGDVGLDDAALSALAASIKDRHWTIVLVKDAQGSVYHDAEGRTHHGLESYKFGLGQGLSKLGGFAAQTHEASGLADGSILLVSFAPRFIFAVNSAAQRANGLDATVSNADAITRWAKPLLQQGKVADAVLAAVEKTDTALDESVANAAAGAKSQVASAKSALEKFALARADFQRTHASAAETVGVADLGVLRSQLAAAERALSANKTGEAIRIADGVSSAARAASSAMSGYEANYGTGKSAIATARGEVDTLERASNSFLKDHPKATGDLARPDVRGMRETLKSAEALLSSKPSEAKSSAETVGSEVRRVQTALNEHAAGGDQIAAAESLLKQLEGRERANSAYADLVTAKQSLRDAREAHGLGASTWASQLQSAKSALDNAERAITAADVAAKRAADEAAAAATRNAIFFWGFLALMTLLTGGTAVFLYRRASRKAAEAQAIYDTWAKDLQAMSNSNIDVLMEKVALYGDADSPGAVKRGYTGQSDIVAGQVRTDSREATLLLDTAKTIHGLADALLHPKTGTFGWAVNILWTSRSAEAVRILKDEPVKPFNKSFNEVIADFNAKKDAALASVERLEYAVTQSGKVIDAVAAELKASAERKTSDALFAVPSLFATTIPAGDALAAKARETVKTDPLSGIYGEAEKAKLIATDADALLDLIDAARAGSLAASTSAEKALSARGVAAAWIQTTAGFLSAGAEAVAAAAATPAFAEALKTLNAGLEALAARADRASTIARKLDEIVLNNAGKAEAAIVAARTEIGAALKLDPEKTMREKGDDPSENVLEARRLAAEAKANVAAGELDAADAAGASASKNADEASAIAASSLHSLHTQEKTFGEREAETSRLTGLVPERSKELDKGNPKSIVSQFHESVLKLTSGDAGHPNANGTIADNIDEAEVAIAAAKAKTAASVKAFTAGRLLEAASLLSQAQAHQQIADVRLAEIAEKRTRLDASVAANTKTLAALETKVRGWKAEIPDDRRTMDATVTAYEKASKALKEAKVSVEAEKGNPFTAMAELAAVSASLDQVWVQVGNDRAAYDEVVRSLNAADSQLDAAMAQARIAEGDGITDSSAITSALNELRSLRSDYDAAAAASKAAHGKWPKIDQEADRITTTASHVAATLKGEIAEAARATEAISSAASKVREATNWTGSYGVSVPGSPGGSELNMAKASLNSGDYDGAIRYAQNGAAAAASAISAAEHEVARRRREEEEERRRQEEERRRRQQEEDDRRRRAEDDARRRREDDDRRSSGGGGGGFGGGSSGGGGGGFGGSSSGGGGSSW